MNVSPLGPDDRCEARARNAAAFGGGGRAAPGAAAARAEVLVCSCPPFDEPPGPRRIVPAGGASRVRARGALALRALAARVVALPVVALPVVALPAWRCPRRARSCRARPGAARLPAPTRAWGYDYVFRISQETVDERGRARREPAFVARARHRGSLVRVDFLPGTEGSNTPGDWYLTGDGGRTMTLVDERRRAHFLLDVASVREQVGDEKGLAVRVRDLAVSVRPEGPCGAVAGWATTCVTVDRRYTVRTRYWMMRHETRVVERVRYWVSPALADLAAPWATFFGSRTDLLVRRDSGFVAREREVARALGPGGVLRMEVAHTEATGGARAPSRG
jgi:hypothetical protein